MSVKIKIKPSYILQEKVRVDGKKAIISKIEKNNTNKIFIKYTDPYDIEQFGNSNILVLKEDINKDIRNDIFISPEKSTWISPQRKEFIEWINKTFQYANDVEKNNNSSSPDFKLFKQQKFVRDFLQLDSPYRGLLLYHGLGSGKTCASIAIAENLKNDKDIIVVLPASLQLNFIVDGLKKCGSKSYQEENGIKQIEKYYKFISLNSQNTLQTFERMGNIDNSVIIIDEVHNLISRIVSSFKGASSQGKGIYEFLMTAKNVKYVFLSGIPLVNSIFEAGIICNILRGYIQLHIFDILKISGIPDKNTNIAQLKINLEELKFVEYLNINIANRTIEITSSLRQHSHDFDECMDFIIKAAKSAGVDLKYNSMKEFSLFPETEELFDSYFLTDKNTEKEKLINKSMLQRRMLGLISYFKPVDDKSYPTLNPTKIIKVPMSDYQFTMYSLAREKERVSEKASARGRKKAKVDTSKSVFRIFSRMISNFTFPKKIKRYDFIKANNNNTKNFQQNIEEIKEYENESKNEDEKKTSTKKRIQKKMKEEKILSIMKKDSNKYLSNDALEEYSPKMKMMMDMISNTDGLILIYSQFVSIEGITIFSYVLEQNGFEKYDGKNEKPALRYTVFTGKEKDKEKEKSIKTFNLEKNKDGDIIKVLLISSSGAEGLDLRNIRSVFIMEPHWNEARINQVIGRARRKNSHMDLPKKMRYVNVFRFHSVLTKEQLENIGEDKTSDEHIFCIAKKKEKITEEILKLMKEVAVDCNILGYKNCFSFGKGAKGLSYLPKIRDDELYSQKMQTRKQKVKLIKGGITKDGKVVLIDNKKKKVYYATNSNMLVPLKKIPKIKKKVFINPVTGDVYDEKSTLGGNPIIIGTVNEDSAFIK